MDRSLSGRGSPPPPVAIFTDCGATPLAYLLPLLHTAAESGAERASRQGERVERGWESRDGFWGVLSEGCITRISTTGPPHAAALGPPLRARPPGSGAWARLCADCRADAAPAGAHGTADAAVRASAPGTADRAAAPASPASGNWHCGVYTEIPARSLHPCSKPTGDQRHLTSSHLSRPESSNSPPAAALRRRPVSPSSDPVPVTPSGDPVPVTPSQ